MNHDAEIAWRQAALAIMYGIVLPFSLKKDSTLIVGGPNTTPLPPSQYIIPDVRTLIVPNGK